MKHNVNSTVHTELLIDKPCTHHMLASNSGCHCSRGV